MQTEFFEPNLHQEEIQRVTESCGPGATCQPLIHPCQNTAVVCIILGSDFPLIANQLHPWGVCASACACMCAFVGHQRGAACRPTFFFYMVFDWGASRFYRHVKGAATDKRLRNAALSHCSMKARVFHVCHLQCLTNTMKSSKVKTNVSSVTVEVMQS